MEINTGSRLAEFKALIEKVESHDFIYILLTIHDCLKILKTLALHRPTEATCFSLENLLYKDGQIKLSDVYLSKAKMKKEIQFIRNKKHA